MTDTLTRSCPTCGGDREITVEADYSPAERMTLDYPGAPASWEVSASCADACECGHTYTDAELQAITDAYEPEVLDKSDFIDEDYDQ